MSNTPTISVIIPVKNEAAGIAACLDGILAQTVPVLEILVIDSGSTDGTQEIVLRYAKARLIEIPSSEFNHGDTRNLGVRESRGDYILFTVGDARPADERWIARLLEGFVADDVLIVSGTQVVPHSPITNPLEWFRPVSKPRLAVFRFGSAEAYDATGGEDRRQACVVDDVTALYRRKLFDTVQFRRLVYGEDIFIAIDTLRAGFAIARNPAAYVYHYHLDNYATTLKRTVTVAILRYELFGFLPAAPRYEPLRNLVRLTRERSVAWNEKFRWWRHNNELVRAISDGIALVRSAAASGPDRLASLHQEYAGTPPIPLKRHHGEAP